MINFDQSECIERYLTMQVGQGSTTNQERAERMMHIKQFGITPEKHCTRKTFVWSNKFYN